jgi:hypothetical protein
MLMISEALKIVPPSSWSKSNSSILNYDSISINPTIQNVSHISNGVFYQTHRKTKASMKLVDYRSIYGEDNNSQVDLNWNVIFGKK